MKSFGDRTFHHAKNVTGVQLLLEASDDLRTWSRVPASLQELADFDPTTERVQMADDAPLTSRASRFDRLEVR